MINQMCNIIHSYLINTFGYYTGNVIKNILIGISWMEIGAIVVLLFVGNKYLKYKKTIPALRKPSPDGTLSYLRLYEKNGNNEYLEDADNLADILDNIFNAIRIKYFSKRSYIHKNKWRAYTILSIVLGISILILVAGLCLTFHIMDYSNI